MLDLEKIQVDGGGGSTIYARHPLSAAWPDMDADDFRSLRDSIVNHGQQEPILLFEGQILDGWQRYQACLAEDIEPRFDAYFGDEPAEYVCAKHTRRPLSLTQRLTALALMNQWRPSGVTNSAARSAESADLTTAGLAAQGGGSLRSAGYVKAAIAHGATEVVDAMKAGTLAADHAAQIAKLPKEQQAAAVAAPRKPVKHRGKPKKVPAVKLMKAEIKASDAENTAAAAQERVAGMELEISALREQLSEAQDDLAAALKALEADDALAAAMADAKEARDLARGYKDRINSMTTQIADLKRSVAHWEKKARVPG